MTEWKTIDSAPKDGRELLMFGRQEWHHADYDQTNNGHGHASNDTDVFVARWSKQFNKWIGGTYHYYSARMDYRWMEIYPTHWMPLPQPPK